MTVYVETDFLVALLKDTDWLKSSVRESLDTYDPVTSPYSYLEILLVRDRDDFDFVTAFSNLLEVVPVRTEVGRQIVLKAVNYFEEGLTPFDAFHAATAETHRQAVLSSDKVYEGVEPRRLPLEPGEDTTDQ